MVVWCMDAMVRSMTAFARCEETAAGFGITWELRSANHRFLDAQFRLPEELRSLEHPLRNSLFQHIKRGKLMCTLAIELKTGAHAFELNRPLLLQLLATLEQVRRDAPEAPDANSVDLLRWPGILKEAASGPNEPLAAAVRTAFKTALERLQESRMDEGAQLKAQVLVRLDEIERIMRKSRPLVSALAEEMQARLQMRLARLEASVVDGRLEQEVALLAQKADVAEELDRLGIHLQEARAHLGRPGPHGRRLDFLAQELMREANTLNAKSVLPRLSLMLVDLKVAIEQIREQAQNIE